MKYKDSLLGTVRILSVWILMIVFVAACKPADLTTITPSDQSAIVTETEVIIPTAPVEITPETPTPSFSPTLTLTLTPIVVNTVTPTLSPLQKVAELPISTFDFTISDDGTLLVYEDEKGIIHVLNTNNWEAKWEIEEDNRGMIGYMVRDFSPDGRFLAGAGIEQDVFVWDMITGETIYAFPVPYDDVNNISFSPDSKLLSISAIETYSASDAVMIWDLEIGQLIPNQINMRDYVSYVMATIFVPNQTDLLAVSAANLNPPEDFRGDERIGGLFFWDIDNQQLQEVITGIGGTLLIASPNGQVLAVSVDDSYHFWDIQNAVEVLNLGAENLGGSRVMSLTDTGLIANANTEGLTIWNLQGKLIATLTTDKVITDIEFLPGDELLIAYGDDKPMEIWKVNK